MLVAAALAVLVTMTLAIVRALRGPSIYDRILAVNMFGTKTVLLIALISGLANRGDYLDVALVYAMINFIAIMAVMKYFQYGSLGHAGNPPANPGSKTAADVNAGPDGTGTSDLHDTEDNRGGL